MPVNIFKTSIEYCIENKLFFLFVLCVLFGLQYLTNLIDSRLLGPVIIGLVVMGYGLQVTEDIIKGGKRLPKIMPKKVIAYGIKGYVIFGVYVLIQGALLYLVSKFLKFPSFTVIDFILNYKDSMHFLLNNEPVSAVIFIISTFVIVYVTTFFMELALARFADGGSLLNAFNFPRIKHAIDVIGWRNYAWRYTKIIFAIVVLTHMIRYEVPILFVDSVIDAVLSFLIFVIEYMGIGFIYRYYVEHK